MKKQLLFVLLLSFTGLVKAKAGGNPPASLSGIYLVGASHEYKKLTDVAAALNNSGNTVTGNVIFELDSDYDGTTGETFPVTFKQFNSSGSWTVTIRPKEGVSLRTTAGDPGAAKALIALDGADNIILDGRAGGSGNSIGWLIRNTNTGTGADATVYLVNDAQNNTLTWLQLEGQTTTTGVVYGGGTTGAQGNDNNTISYCRIRDRSDLGGKPSVGICFKGNITSTPEQRNSGTLITHNDLVNICNSVYGGVAISFAYNNTEVTITHNNIYLTAPVSGARITFNGIGVSEKTMSGVTITDNFIGGSAPGCGGAPFTIISTSRNTAVAGIFTGTSDATGTGTVIADNTITNFDITLGEIMHDEYYFRPFAGITVPGSETQVVNNTIGSTTANDAIKITLNNGAAATYNSYGITGISFNSRLGGRVAGNKFGGLTVGGSMNSTQPSGILGISAQYAPLSAAPLEITGNTIGSTTVSNSIRVTSSSVPMSFSGIQASIAQPVNIRITGNTVAGVSLGYTGTSVAPEVNGIISSGTGDAVIDSNLVANCSSASQKAAAAPLIRGIWSTGDSSVISRNTIRALRLTATAAITASSPNTTIVSGIVADGALNADVYNNQLYDFTSANNISSGPTRLEGISTSVRGDIYNNLVSLDNGSNTNNCEIFGLRAHTGTAYIEIFHNTLYIGGNNGATANTAISASVARHSASTTCYLRANLLVNARTGGNSSHYLLLNPLNPPTTGWSTSHSNYNVLITANISKVGKWNTTDRDSTQWKTVSDANSTYRTITQAPLAGLFNNLTELDINDDAWDLVRRKGSPGVGVLADYVGEKRYIPAPTAGAYEYPLAALKGLTISAGALSPVFHRRTLNYIDTVGGDIATVTVTATALNPEATLKINNAAVTSGTASAPIVLNAGANTITIVVTAPGGIIKTYTIKVTKRPAVLNGTYTVGNSQPVYKKLTHVANALKTLEMSGNVVFELDSDYDGSTGETFPITFSPLNARGGDWTVTIRPKAGVATRTTAGSPGSYKGLILLDSADRITFDGRPGGVGDTTGWIIRNTTATSAGATIQFANDAQNNKLTYLQLEGQSTVSTTGVVCLGGTQSTQGNDNNTISYCTITGFSTSTAVPGIGIYSASEVTDTAAFNSGNVITHNRLVNIYKSSGSSIGISLDLGTGSATVANNSFYQTRTITNTGTASIIYGIYVNEPAASNVIIADNYIGGTAPECGGTAYKVSSTGTASSRFIGISFANAAATGGDNSIRGNTIRKIDLATDRVPSPNYAIFYAIQAAGSRVDIADNKIGNTDGYDDIKITIGSAATNIIAPAIISFTSRLGGNITDNTIGGITIAGTTHASSSNILHGINVSFSPPDVGQVVNISDNQIGSTSLADNIRFSSVTAPFSFNGISVTLPVTTLVNYKNNTIGGVTFSYNGSGANPLITGINNTSGSTAIIDGNTISDLYSPLQKAGLSYNFQGIATEGDSTVIRNNIIRRLRLTATGPVAGTAGTRSYVTGLVLIASSSSKARIYNNKIYDLTSVNELASPSATMLTGMDIRTNAEIYNNLISLTNGDNINNCEIAGIRASNPRATIYHNTIYIGGDNGTASNEAISYPLGRVESYNTLTFRNNLLINERTGGNGSHFLFYNNASSPDENWTPATSDYNVLVTTDSARIGRWNTTALDAAQWRVKGGDEHSAIYSTAQIASSALLMDKTDLEVKPDARDYVAGAGTPTPISIDYLGQARNALVPTAGAYEYPAAVLKDLVVSNGVLAPVFNRITGAYADTVAVNSITVTPVAADPAAAITVNGQSVTSGTASAPIMLATGSNTVTVKVTATDGFTGKMYTIGVVKQEQVLSSDASLAGLVLSAGTLSPLFDAGAADYTASVSNVTSSLTVMPSAAHAAATIQVNGMPVASGNLSQSIALDPGANTITIVVTAENGSTTRTYKVVVTRDAIPNNAPTGLSLSSLSVQENAVAGTAIGSFIATDADAGDAFTYTLISGDGSTDNTAFTIEGDVLKINTSPDYETKNAYSIRVRVTDGGGLYFEELFTIDVEDLNEYAPVITSHGGAASVTLSVAENQTAVTAVTAGDADGGTITYSVLPNDDGAYFTVNSTTGELVFNAAPDFEHPSDPDENNMYMVTVQASDGAFTAVQRFKIRITDANDQVPEFGSYAGDASVNLQIAENIAAVGTVWAIDKDQGTTIVYRIAAGQDGALFSVDPVTGMLRFVTAPDFDQPGDTNGDNIYTVTVEAFDGALSASQRFKIKITNENDNTPVFTSHNGDATVELQVPENSTAVTTAGAADGDAGAVITYSIAAGGDGALFTVDPASGKLTFVNAPDFEQPADGNADNIYSVTVSASDGSLSSTQQFNIKITDVYDTPMMLTMTMKLPENTVEVTNLEATGGVPGGGLTLAIFGEEDAALFAIDQASGNLVFITAPDFEQPADANSDNIYMVSVKMSDGSSAVILRLKIKITDVDETSRMTNRSVVMPEAEKTIIPGEKTSAGIKVYPNPVTGKRFTLRMDSLTAGRYLLEIYTTGGQLVYRQQLNHTGKTVAYPMQLPAGLLKGVYVLRLTGVHTSHSEKLFID